MMKIINVIIAGIFLSSLFFYTGCGKKEDQKTGTPGDQVTDRNITITADQARAVNMNFLSPRKADIPEQVHATGYIEAPPQNLARVSPVIAGYVVEVKFLEGDRVSRGQSLFLIRSQELIEMQQNYLELKSRMKYLGNDYERQKTLSEDNINARKMLDLAEAEYKTTAASFEGIKEKLLMAGLNLNGLESGNVVSELSVKSPIDGYISEIEVVTGQYIKPGDYLCEIINPTHLHADLHVFEKDAIKVKSGQKLTLRVAQSGKHIQGEVIAVNKKLEEDTRTVRVHGHFTEVDAVLPGMFAEAEINVSENSVWVLPNTAIYKGENEKLVFRLTGRDQETINLEMIRVSVGKETGDVSEIIFPGTLVPDTTAEYANNGLHFLINMVFSE